ncbi:MAG: hypothetical protein R3E13_05315 [Alphaproteobacteria bacterium]
MKPDKQNETGADEIEIIHRINRLKEKVSAPAVQNKNGCVNPRHITEAQSVIDATQDDCTQALSHAIENLETMWKKTSEHNEENRQSTLHEIHRHANFIKDIASTYHHELMSYFGQSLRDLTDRIDIANTAHRTIVKAHIDVMNIALQNSVKTDKGDLAKELKQMLEKAIHRHFPACAAENG